ncbi:MULTISPECIES: cysteine hydrolase family protein [Marinobacter]|uniref:Cysteine hydrolase n=1 Tax=Marinobacter profundi TaxID=2666256 RepID=A0A2G1UJC8_9GAMM|nr:MULTISPECIES: cysteine hydrolase family protein [Marinobacter]MBD3656925.1 cysteine hydrolase [Marinobacter sp.]PHQ14578.1 cysteine hydrolase [Marinobacter profundi]
MSKRAVIVVDVQNEYFASGKLPLVNIEKAAANAARVIAKARQNKDLLVHVHHESLDPNAPFFTQGTDGVQIHESVAPRGDEPVILKNYPNSFLNTNLKELLETNGIEEVVVIGAMSHMCIEATSRAASDFGYKVTVLEDACATMDLEFNGVTVPAAQVHATAMAALGFAYAGIQSTGDEL